MSTKPNPSSFPDLVTPTEAAKLLRISRTVIYRLKEALELPFYVVSASIRFRKEDLLAYLDRNAYGVKH